MKKLLVSLLAVAALAACTNDQTLVQRGNAPMEFAGAFVDNATRADVGKAVDPSTTTGTLTGFKVWAFMDEPAGIVFNGENVTGSKGNFSYVNTQYWVPNHDYYFAALAPIDNAHWTLNTKNADGEYIANEHGAGVVEFHNDTAKGTEDLLYAATSVSTQNMALGADMEAVKFQFNHLLSKVKFSFTNSFPNENARIDVKNVTMKVPASASINLAQADWWSTNQWENYSGEATLEFGDACAKTGKGVTQETANERLTIPAGADQSYIVTFDVALYYGDRLAFEKTGITTTIDGVALEIGKSYNFTANLNASNIAGDTKLTSIDFDVEEVKEWDEKTVSLIDTPAKLVEAIEGDEVDHIILDGNINLDDLLSTGTLSTRAGSSSASITIPADKEVVLDLKDFTITGTDNDTASFGMFNIQPGAKLTIEGGNGKIQLTATKNRGWNAYSSVISNQRGEFVLNGGTIEHLGGTDMAYGIDNLTNTGAGDAKVTINGGVVTTPYRAVRQFLNSTKALCEVVVNGGKIYSNGGNKAIWVQNANAKVNPGKLVVAADAEIGDVMVSGNGATELDIELSVAKAALMEGAQVTISSSNAPAGYEVVLENDVWTINYNPYYDHEKVANGLYKKDKTYVAINGEGLVALSGMTIKDGEIVTLGADIDLTGVEFNGLQAFNPETNNTFDGNNYTVSNWTNNSKASDMGFFKGWVGTIKNVNFENCHLQTSGRSAIVAANTYCNIDKVNVNNCSIEDSYWACGIIAGLFNSGSISNCTVTNSSVKSNGGTGGIVGAINESAGTRKVENCKVEGCTVNNTGAYGETYSGALICGMINISDSTVEFNGCSFANNSKEGKYVGDLYYSADEDVTVTIDGKSVVKISTVEELNALKATNAYVMLCADLDFQGAAMAKPIELWKDSTFDGMGHKISNVTTAVQGGYATSLFRGDANPGNKVVKNLVVENLTTPAGYSFAAAIWSDLQGANIEIDNVHVNNATIAANGTIGGFVGFVSGSTTSVVVKNSTINNSNLNGGEADHKRGAVVGRAYGCVVNCENVVVENVMINDVAATETTLVGDKGYTGIVTVK